MFRTKRDARFCQIWMRFFAGPGSFVTVSASSASSKAVLRPVRWSPVLVSSTNSIVYEHLFMSHTQPSASSSYGQAPNFHFIINNALDAYKKRTKKDLLAHPLVTTLESCNSPSTILAVLQEQVQGLDQSGSGDERWTRWLNPTVNVLYTLSGTLGEGAGLVCLRK